MPHQCTNCGKTFADGSKQMLSGCPECGGNKFQFQPSSAVRSSNESSDTTDSAASPQPVEPSPATDDESSDRGSVAETAAKARSSVREWVGNRTGGDSDGAESADAGRDTADTDVSFPADETSTESPTKSSAESSAKSSAESAERSEPGRAAADETEDHAQASARSDVVTPEELSAARDEAAQRSPAPDDADGTVIEPSSDDRPDLSELRDELNDQFESIKILSPGQYELNLMELYDRDEYIISLREDGRYVIEVADSWKHDDDR